MVRLALAYAFLFQIESVVKFAYDISQSIDFITTGFEKVVRTYVCIVSLNIPCHCHSWKN